MPERRNTRLAGHSLQSEGKPYSRDPRPGHGLNRTYWTDLADRIGMALCSCGKTSPELATDAERRRWHRDVHKPAVRAEQQRGGASDD